jgi:Rrf2 family nitric oxide-sensitive transcriptional repressor
MLSQTAEYALRAVAELARHHPAARTAARIAEATQVPLDYLSKVMRQLERSKVVRSRRGPNGGFELRSAPERTSVYEVIQAVDPIERIRTCPLGLREHAGGALCPLHRLLDDAYLTIETAFRSTNVAELVKSPRGVLCAHPSSSRRETRYQPVRVSRARQRA